MAPVRSLDRRQIDRGGQSEGSLSRSAATMSLIASTFSLSVEIQLLSARLQFHVVIRRTTRDKSRTILHTVAGNFESVANYTNEKRSYRKQITVAVKCCGGTIRCILKGLQDVK